MPHTPTAKETRAPERPLILISNDDGINAPGVYRLIDYLADMAEIVCVCPDSPRSAQSMALTVTEVLRLDHHPDYNGAQIYSCSGTPADCVKLAMRSVLERRPALVIGGINHGSNSGVNLLYSGTMGVATEGCVFGVPSIGFSLTTHRLDADFSRCRRWVREITRKVLENGLPDGVCLNVNIPYDGPEPQQMRVVRQCHTSWSEEYKRYTDPMGRPFYMLSGHFVNEEPESTDTDEWCLSHGIVAVVPVLTDRTAPLSTISFLE